MYLLSVIPSFRLSFLSSVLPSFLPLSSSPPFPPSLLHPLLPPFTPPRLPPPRLSLLQAPVPVAVKDVEGDRASLSKDVEVRSLLSVVITIIVVATIAVIVVVATIVVTTIVVITIIINTTVFSPSVRHFTTVRTSFRKICQCRERGRTSFGLTPRTSLKKKYDLLLVFQKQRFCLDTNSKCQYDNEGPPSKNRHIEDDVILIFKNSHIYDTHSQGYYCQTKTRSSTLTALTYLSETRSYCSEMPY
jgi:hypothetical protein